MEENKPLFVSEWNEQQLFSNMFFNITYECRLFQSLGKPFEWKNKLDSKISLIIGIVNEDEKKKIFKLRSELNKLYYWANRMPMKYITPLFDKLFYAEADIDRMAHKHMPFLKLKRMADIGGL